MEHHVAPRTLTEEILADLWVQGLAEQQRAAQQRQRAAMERLRRPGKR